MNNEDFERSVEDAKLEINKNIDSFKEHLEAGSSDPDHFITLADIEKEWGLLRKTTDKTYSDMVSSYLSNVDEKELIKRKK